MTLEHNYDAELSAAEKAAQEAGDLVMGLFKGKYDVHEKSKNNPVTTADLEANRIIREKIDSVFPGDGWLSEEDLDSSRRLKCSRVWVVDPIDGTREFIEGIPQFAISIAFVLDGVPKVSVVFNPAEKQFYKAAVGRGAFFERSCDPSYAPGCHRRRVTFGEPLRAAKKISGLRRSLRDQAGGQYRLSFGSSRGRRRRCNDYVSNDS